MTTTMMRASNHGKSRKQAKAVVIFTKVAKKERKEAKVIKKVRVTRRGKAKERRVKAKNRQQILNRVGSAVFLFSRSTFSMMFFGRPPHDGFADFYGYNDEIVDDPSKVPAAGAIFLPDHDPDRVCGREVEAALSPGEAEAFETTLIMLRSLIQEKKDLADLSEGADAAKLRHELECLKLQTARLAEFLWNVDSGSPCRDIEGIERRLEEATKFSHEFGELARDFAAEFN